MNSMQWRVMQVKNNTGIDGTLRKYGCNDILVGQKKKKKKKNQIKKSKINPSTKDKYDTSINGMIRFSLRGFPQLMKEHSHTHTFVSCYLFDSFLHMDIHIYILSAANVY